MKARLITFIFADLQPAASAAPPPTRADAQNALVTIAIGWLWIILAAAVLAWIVWWAVRMRRGIKP